MDGDGAMGFIWSLSLLPSLSSLTPPCNALPRHDTVEDTATTIEDIRTAFGDAVAALVAEVTDDKELPKQERKTQQIAHAAAASPGAKIIKLADKLYNLRDLQREIPASWTSARAQAYFGWASEVVAGCRSANKPLADAVDVALAGTFTAADGVMLPCLVDGYTAGDWKRDTPLTDK